MKSKFELSLFEICSEYFLILERTASQRSAFLVERTMREDRPIAMDLFLRGKLYTLYT